jgi:hypothetical protein
MALVPPFIGKGGCEKIGRVRRVGHRANPAFRGMTCPTKGRQSFVDVISIRT